MSELQKRVTGAIRTRTVALSVPDRHLLKISKQAMGLSCLGTRILGGPNHQDAAIIIHRLIGAFVAIDSDCTCKRTVTHE